MKKSSGLAGSLGGIMDHEEYITNAIKESKLQKRKAEALKDEMRHLDQSMSSALNIIMATQKVNLMAILSGIHHERTNNN